MKKRLPGLLNTFSVHTTHNTYQHIPSVVEWTHIHNTMLYTAHAMPCHVAIVDYTYVQYAVVIVDCMINNLLQVTIAQESATKQTATASFGPGNSSKEWEVHKLNSRTVMLYPIIIQESSKLTH